MTEDREEQHWADISECVRRQERNNYDFNLHACDFGCMSSSGVCDYNLGNPPEDEEYLPF